jgi:hypothetical protein
LQASPIGYSHRFAFGGIVRRRRQPASNWPRIQALSHACALLEQLAWKLEPRYRDAGFEILKRINERLSSEIVGLISCEFDSARRAAAHLAQEKERREMECRTTAQS